MLEETIATGFKVKLVKPSSLQRVVVDATVQERGVAFLTDAKIVGR